ncbi:CapA family protein [Leucobacter sp. G161]|uniref:CapA family protein n=1 Tax=Leucobacter sp. G161 TaxID=663704 RepID=UPI00073B6D2D|nr:CapA family protein [Leucobacter sp. G161]KUF07385.1 capsule biosynthesis protein CapA [Leucobacter sp. G161]
MTDTEPTGSAKRRPSTTTVIAVIVATVLVIAAAVAAAVLFFGGDPTPPAKPEPAATAPAQTPEEPAEPAGPEAIRVIAMGDMLPHDSVNENAKQADGSYDYAPFFAGLRSQLDAADVTFCNQEVPSAGVEFGISGYPTFNAPTEFARDLRGAAGCDLVNLATNHNADKGVAGIAATRAAWDGLGPAVVNGASRNADEQSALTVFEHDGVQIALVSFAEFSNAPIDKTSMNFMDDDALVQRLVTQAREQADIVLVSAHWGTEDSHEVNDAQRAFAAKVSALGADVIIGTGPHVLQSVEWLDCADGKQTLVWYSIGNMLSTQLELDQRTGVVAGFDIVKDDAGKFSIANPTAMPTYMHYEWTAEQEAAGDLLARTNLSLTPLADAAPLFAGTRFDTSAAEQFAATKQILGEAVAVRER